ncbi:MAG: DUF1810 domain-containing protein [Bacilli bacterium]|nr:DUF1810 domain-containing protein [Bacilli bacterium]
MERFIEIQKQKYNQALSEIKNGKKETHWMWYIFPQIKGLGQTATSIEYAINDLDEAKEYLDNDYLRNNLENICSELLKLDTSNPINIFGTVDSLKLRSSMTLFYLASNEEIYKKVLDKYYHGELDQLTIDILNEKKRLFI